MGEIDPDADTDPDGAETSRSGAVWINGKTIRNDFALHPIPSCEEMSTARD